MLCFFPSPTASPCLTSTTLGYVCNIEVSPSSPMQVTQSPGNTLKTLFLWISFGNESPSWEQGARCLQHVTSLGRAGEGACTVGGGGWRVTDLAALKQMKITVCPENSAHLFWGAARDWQKAPECTSAVVRQQPTFLSASYSMAQWGQEPQSPKPRYQTPFMRQTHRALQCSHAAGSWLLPKQCFSFSLPSWTAGEESIFHFPG